MTSATLHEGPPSTAVTGRVAFVDCTAGFDVPEHVSSRFGPVGVDRVPADEFARYLHETGSAGLAVVFAAAGSTVPDAIRTLRERREFARTRAYVLGGTPGEAVPGWTQTYDVEDILTTAAVTGGGLANAVELGLRAYHSLVRDPLYRDYYLDTTFNKIFDWFETTRWNWDEINLDEMNPELLREDERDYLTEAAIIEFGTLPGAHNFLREWEGEVSFSSWALQWGAEESRHSLVQSRYLDRLGIKIRSKHALYKREPYPIGDTWAGTLMMNIISEARASEYYSRLAADTREPVIKRIWRLLGRDEARHARAFYVFSKELCEDDPRNQVAALKMAYVWLADRSEGIKHPAGHFYPHSTSAKGIRRIEQLQEGSTDAADGRVLAMVRRLADDDSIETPRDIKNKLRVLTRPA